MFLLVHGRFEENCIPDEFLFKRAFQIRAKKGMQVLSIHVPCHMHYVLHSSFVCVRLCSAMHAISLLCHHHIKACCAMHY